MKTTELKFEVQTGDPIMDMFGEELCVAVGTDNNDSDIRIEDIEHPEFEGLFEEVCENVFVLSSDGKTKFREKQDVIDWCSSIGMILD